LKPKHLGFLPIGFPAKRAANVLKTEANVKR